MRCFPLSPVLPSALPAVISPEAGVPGPALWARGSKQGVQGTPEQCYHADPGLV